MIPLCIPCLTGNEDAYLHECITTNFVSSVGTYVGTLEKMVAECCGAKAAVATQSGTAGLQVALTAVGVRRDDVVILPSFTFIASANAISYCGATPWLLDIAPDSLTLNVDKLSRALAEETIRRPEGLIHKKTGKRVSAILPVYTLGHPADMRPIQALASQYELPLVADAACALGARYQNRPLADFSDLCVFSFNGNKTFTCGGGGAIAGNDSALLAQCRHLSTTARVGKEYHHDLIGFNYRMSNISAAVGCAQLERFEEFVTKKRAIAQGYTKATETLDNFDPLPNAAWAESACWISGVMLHPGVRHEIAEIINRLAEWGIESRVFWKPIHLQPPYREAPVSDVAFCDSVWQRILALPCSIQLSVKDQSYIINCLHKLDAELGGVYN